MPTSYSKMLHKIFSQIHGPKFSLKLWDIQERFYGTGPSTTFTIIIDSEETVKRLLTQGSLGFGEAYMEGHIDIEGDLEAYLRLRHQFKHVNPPLRLIWKRFLMKKTSLREREGHISRHYDLGNDFFKMILDSQTMSYSAGFYEQGSETLEEAQQKKIELVSHWIDLPPGAKVLDLGFGWGGFAQYTAEKRGWNITGYTLSNAQLQYCQEWNETNHAQQSISLEHRDMLGNMTSDQFDAIIMLESIEHIGQKEFVPFFRKLQNSLKPGGFLYIQTTGRYVSRPVDKWTLKYVFPGGYLPAKKELLTAALKAGLVVEKFQDNTPDYIHTMTMWIKNLESHQVEIEDKFGKSFYRLWKLWMHGAKVSFEVNSMNLFRLYIRRPK